MRGDGGGLLVLRRGYAFIRRGYGFYTARVRFCTSTCVVYTTWIRLSYDMRTIFYVYVRCFTFSYAVVGGCGWFCFSVVREFVDAGFLMACFTFWYGFLHFCCLFYGGDTVLWLVLRRGYVFVRYVYDTAYDCKFFVVVFAFWEVV